jgi:hypothetical protein
MTRDSGRLRFRKILLATAVVMPLVIVLGTASAAEAWSIKWSGTPGNVTFYTGPAGTDGHGPARIFMGVSSDTSNNFRFATPTATAAPSSGNSNYTYWQYVQFYIRAYYLCGSTGTSWCFESGKGEAQSWYSGWFHPGQTITPNVALNVAVPTGRYWTMLATTTWYNSNGYVIAQETYYPDQNMKAKFDVYPNNGGYPPGAQMYGSYDMACHTYAYQIAHQCTPYGLYNSYNLKSPSGYVYMLYAG